MELAIKQPYIHRKGTKSRLVYVLKAPESEDYPLYFEVDSRYEQYLTDELSDACVVCVLLYAMEKGLNIRCESPVSERLKNQLTRYLIPAISKNIPKYKAIDIICETADIKFDGKAVGTGISCGVDSFYTTLKNFEHADGSPLRITHLCFFNAGASGMYGGERARYVYYGRMKRASDVAKVQECDFLSCDSNMNEFLMQNHQATHTFRTLCIPLALQKLFCLYYFSSGYVFSDFKFEQDATASYDLLTLPNLSNQNVRFELVGGEATRLEKIRYISAFDITKHELNVCIPEISNCCKCTKCRRTMLELYALGVLDEYREVFDVDAFYRNKKQMMRWAIRNRKGVDMPEVVDELIRHQQITVADFLRVFASYPVNFVIKKLRRIKNGGKRATKAHTT